MALNKSTSRRESLPNLQNHKGQVQITIGILVREEWAIAHGENSDCYLMTLYEMGLKARRNKTSGKDGDAESYSRYWLKERQVGLLIHVVELTWQECVKREPF